MYNRLLKQTRETAGLSQEALAEMVGTSASTISGWERYEHQPSAYFRERLSIVLGKSAVELGLLPATASSLAESSIYDPFLPLPTVLLGRDELLVHLRQRLSQVTNRTTFTVLLGLPGVGKTVLAATLARDPKLSKRFPNGILWITLGPNPHFPSLFARWGELLGLSRAEMESLSTKEAWVGALRRAISGLSLLLIIDDAWKVEDVLPLQVGGRNCAYLLTTRFPSVATSLSIDGVMKVEELSLKDGVALLHYLAPLVVMREEPKIEELAQTVGGLPLALTLMGNYLRKQGYSGQHRRIQEALERLSRVEGRLHLSEMRAPVDYYPSLAENTLSLYAMIAIATHYLEEKTRRALHLLAAIFPNTFTEEEALATAVSVEALDVLIDVGLLQWNSEGRYYTLHQTIADYARLAAAKSATADKD